MIEIPKTSKAAVIVAWGEPLEIREYPIPEVEPNGILVKVEMCGICGTDVHQWNGRMPLDQRLPQIPGHETLGRIVKLGEGRTHDAAGNPLKIGDRILWAHVECGKCYWCNISHQPTLCANRTYYAFRLSDEYPHLMGGFAEYEYVIPKTEVIKVPDELADEEVIGVGCAFRTVVAAYERMGGLGVQDTVLVLGAGPVGLYSLLMAVESGARKTILVGAPKERLELAKKWGANHVINIDDVSDPDERKNQVSELTDGIGPDVVIDCTGVPVAFNEGLQMIRKGGKYLVIGQTTPGATSIVPASIVWKGIDIYGTISATISHFHKALQFIKKYQSKYPLGEICTTKFKLEQANEALNAMASGKEIKPAIDNRNR